ncbi:MAG: response regulator, partial [Eubacteriales bacterium]|nr:response regulator [Eubacteriales bacterium]
MSRILIVDDEKSIRKTFEVFLTKEGYEVNTAENVEAAFKIVEEKEFDLVVTDIIMPHTTGMDLLNKVTVSMPDMPIIIMTGEPTIETAKQAVKNSAFDYLVKPINKDTLLKAVKNALDYKDLRDSKKTLEIENKEYRENLEKLVDARTRALQNAMHATISTISSVLELR